MEEKKTTDIKEKNKYIINNTLILLAMAAICAAALYFPIMIVALLFLTPIALKQDMDSKKPIMSVGLIVLCSVFLILTPVKLSLYTILVLSTGLSVLICYFLWRYIKPAKFSEGLTFSIVLSVFSGIIIALIIFMIKEKQSFAGEIVKGLESYILNSDSQSVNDYVNIMYSYIHVLNSSDAESAGNIFSIASGFVTYGSELTKTQKLNAIMPYMQTAINNYSISAMLYYPAFAGIITWWRGNKRYYSNKPMFEEIKDLKPKPFSTFTLPRRLFGIMVMLLIASFLLRSSGSSDMVLYAAGVIQSIASILLAIQGYAVMEYFMKRSRALRYPFFRIILMALITIVSLGLVPVFLGGIDLFVNMRMVYSKTREMKDKIEQVKREKEKRQKEENKDDEK